VFPVPCSRVQRAAWPSLRLPTLALSRGDVGRLVAWVPSPLLEQGC